MHIMYAHGCRRADDIKCQSIKKKTILLKSVFNDSIENPLNKTILSHFCLRY